MFTLIKKIVVSKTFRRVVVAVVLALIEAVDSKGSHRKR